MIEIGAVLRAKVTRVEPYGVYLDHEGQTVCVLLPDVSWRDTRPLRERVKVGTEYDVRVIRYNYRDRIIIGSMRLLHPEENPYRELARLEPGTMLRARILQMTRETVTVELPNSAWGHMPTSDLPPGLQKGDSVDVVIAGLEVDEGRLSVERARPAPGLATGLSAQPTVASL